MVLELGAQQRSNVLKPTVPSALVKTTTGRAQLQLPVCAPSARHITPIQMNECNTVTQMVSCGQCQSTNEQQNTVCTAHHATERATLRTHARACLHVPAHHHHHTPTTWLKTTPAQESENSNFSSKCFVIVRCASSTVRDTWCRGCVHHSDGQPQHSQSVKHT